MDTFSDQRKSLEKQYSFNTNNQVLNSNSCRSDEETPSMIRSTQNASISPHIPRLLIQLPLIQAQPIDDQYIKRPLHQPGLRSPPLLHFLSRSTLPTTQVISQPSTIFSPSRTSDNDGVLSENIAPEHSSAEILRTIHDPDEASTSKSWWTWKFNKPTVNRLLDQEDQDIVAVNERSGRNRKYLSPKNPVVLCHGLMGFDAVNIYPLRVSHWRGIKEALEANGVEVLIARVPGTSSIEERAKVLEKTISDTYTGRSVHLVAHSMGGLDCRYLVTHLKPQDFKVLSITTISTPHRGCSIMDQFIGTVGRERLPSIATVLRYFPGGDGDGMGFEDLTIDAMKKFNESTPNVEGIKYFSWGASASPGVLEPYRISHSLIFKNEGPNDGMVSVESAKWGTYLGNLQDVNHMDLIGWISDAKYKWAEWTGKELKYKPASFYLGVADNLARAVEGQS